MLSGRLILLTMARRTRVTTSNSALHPATNGPWTRFPTAPGCWISRALCPRGAWRPSCVEKGCEVCCRRFPCANDDFRGREGFFVQYLDEPLSVDIAGYQQILLLDVIEHVREPRNLLERLRRQFDYAPRKLIVTTPNIAFVAQLLMLLFGRSSTMDAWESLTRLTRACSRSVHSSTCSVTPVSR